MNNFRLIANVDIADIVAEVEVKHDLFFVDTSRQKNVPEQRETLTIYLRSGVKPYPPGVEGRDVHESRRTKMYEKFPVATRFLEAFVAETGSELGRATIVSLRPQGKVYRHIDRGEYYRVRDRYHLVLKSKLGSVLISGDEQVRLKVGECWWFNNHVPHEAYNDSDEPRIHMIFDVLPKDLVGKVKTKLP